MTDGHERYLELAVGHVLGGLASPAADDFRSHLPGCAACRSRVAELRGIADELAAADRDERERARVRTELPRRVEDDEEPQVGNRTRGRIGVGQVTAAALVVLALAAAVAFWNLHLRTDVAMQSAIVEHHEQTLRVLAGGTLVETSAADGVTALAAIDGDEVAFTLAGVRQVGQGRPLVAWHLALDGEVIGHTVLARQGQPSDGRLATSVHIGGAHQLLISLEPGEPGEAPTGEQLVLIDLREPAN